MEVKSLLSEIEKVQQNYLADLANGKRWEQDDSRLQEVFKAQINLTEAPYENQLERISLVFRKRGEPTSCEAHITWYETLRPHTSAKPPLRCTVIKNFDPQYAALLSMVETQWKESSDHLRTLGVKLGTYIPAIPGASDIGNEASVWYWRIDLHCQVNDTPTDPVKIEGKI